MARPPRIDFPNAVYHVTSRGNGRGVIFWSDEDRQRFLAQLADCLHTAGVQLYAFALMENHFHLMEHGHRAGAAKAVAVELACRLADLSGRAIGEHYRLGSGAVSAIHRKVQEDWHNVLPVVNRLALRLEGKRARRAS